MKSIISIANAVTCLLLSVNLPAQCWQQVSVQRHTVAIKSDGTLWAWGGNDSGETGDGTNYYYFAPVQIGNATNWQQVVTGKHQTFALKIDGTLWAWGRNKSGQLGDGTNTDHNVPVQIGTSTDWQDVAAGDYPRWYSM